VFNYIAFKYSRNFVVLFISLILFYVGFDYMSASKVLPNAANLRTLYVYYNTLFASDVLFPVALVLAMIATKVALIRSNELVVLYAIGYTKERVLRPFFTVAILLTLVYIALHNTSYSYSEEFVRSIADKGKLSRSTRDLFFKHNNYYVHFATLYPAVYKAEDVRVFRKNDEDIIEIVHAKEAYYRDNAWYLPTAQIMRKEHFLEFHKDPLVLYEQKDVMILEGFRPDILNHIYEGQVHYSIDDIFIALALLEEQGLDDAKVLSSLYSMVIYPFFAPALVVMFFFFLPITTRNSRLALNTFVMIVGTLVAWGFLFALARITHSGTFTPYWGIIFPVSLVVTTAMIVWYYKKG